MTVPKYGRVTPLQMHMLELGGEICRWYSVQPPSDEERLAHMKTSRELLYKLTGVDCGYDLQAWHDYLLKHDEHRKQYTFVYAWRVVKPKIDELLQDPERRRLAELLTVSESSHK